MYTQAQWIYQVLKDVHDIKEKKPIVNDNDQNIHIDHCKDDIEKQ